MRVLLVIFVALLVSIAIVYIVGLLLPEKTTATRTTILPASPQAVFNLITNNSKAMEWRTDLRDIKVLGKTGLEQWVEYPKKGNPMTFTVKVKEPFLRYEVDVTDQKIFKGHWVGLCEPQNNGAKVTFTEQATIANPFYRVLSYLFFDLGKTMDEYLVVLQKAVVGQRIEE